MKFLALFIVALSFSTYAGSSGGAKKVKGWRESYGGDSRIAEFKLKAAEVFYHTRFDSYLGKEYSQILKVVDNLQVNCRDDLYLDGEKKQAINYPLRNPQLLELDCTTWSQELTIKQKILLVIHEFLPLMGIEDIDYGTSLKVYEKYLIFKSASQDYNNTGFKDETYEIRLYRAVTGCQTEKFSTLVESGADLFTTAFNNQNLLILALEFGCTEIALELMNYRVPISTETSLPPIFIIGLDFNDVIFSYENKVRLLNKMFKIYPEAFFDVLSSRNIQSINQALFTQFYESRNCYPQSNPLHFLAKAEYFDDNFLKSRVERMIKLLMSFGVNPEQKNACEETPFRAMKVWGLNIHSNS